LKFPFILIIVLYFSSHAVAIEKTHSPILSLNIHKSKLSEKQIDSLYLTAKIWGFFKYYHQDVRDGRFDMDKKLIAALPDILNNPNSDTVNALINHWFLTFSKENTPKHEFLTHDRELINSAICDTAPSHSQYEINHETSLCWIASSNQLNMKSKSQLFSIFLSQRTRSNFYNQISPIRLEVAAFGNEKAYTNGKLNREYKLLSLFRMWNIIEYWFPYKHLIDEDWNSILKSSIVSFYMADNEMAYREVIETFLLKLNDGHARIYEDPKGLVNKRFANYTVPVELNHIDNAVIVAKILISDSNLLLGDVVIEVDGVEIEKLISKNLKFVSASNIERQIYVATQLALRGSSKSVKIKVLRNNKFISVDLERISYLELKKVIDSKKIDPPWFILEDTNIGYIDIGKLKVSQIDQAMLELKDTIGIVFDVREYPLEFSILKLLEHLLPTGKIFAIFTIPEITKPGLFYPQTVSNSFSKSELYNGCISILVGITTGSLGEYTAMALNVAPKSKIVGSKTAGTDGDVIKFVLPGGIIAGFSGAGVYTSHGAETQRVGLKIDIKVQKNHLDILQGNTPKLSKAIKYIINCNS